ncbi:MAG: serine O-acetyltransferase [Candidatus Erginobacter occultus]|nr:serine O-acetyltransferase [Candidatus Erginobacter occultus]
MLEELKKDVKAVFAKDPAARNTLEIILCYPGLHAIWLHRTAHFFWRCGLRLLARVISQFSRLLTGVEIHPGAEIGEGVFIDHGAGVVIGETAEVGDGCLLFQGAILGGTSKTKTKRHPTLGKNVEVGAGAIILGPLHIGDGARIGAGSVVIRDVPTGSIAVGIPARVALGFSPKDIEELQHGKLPDPVAEAFKEFIRMYDRLSARLAKLESQEGLSDSIDRAWEEKKQNFLKEFFPGGEKFNGGAGI